MEKNKINSFEELNTENLRKLNEHVHFLYDLIMNEKDPELKNKLLDKLEIPIGNLLKNLKTINDKLYLTRVGLIDVSATYNRIISYYNNDGLFPDKENF